MWSVALLDPALPGGEELAGVVAEREQRMVADSVLERRRGLLLLRVADQHVRVEVDHQRVHAVGAGHSGAAETLAGGLRALLPHHLAGPRPRTPTTASRRWSRPSSSRQHVLSEATGPNRPG